MTSRPTGAGTVLVRLPNWLGDALMARPFLAALRARAGSGGIVAQGPPSLLELMAPDRTWDRPASWPADPNTLATLRSERFAAAYVLPPSFSSAWFAWRTGARERTGFAADGRSPLLTRAVLRPPRGDRHLAREYLALLDETAGENEGAVPVPILEPTRAARREADGLLAGRESPDTPLAIVAPGAQFGPAKRWPVGRFAAVARALSEAGHAVLACGGDSDREVCDAVVREAGRGCVSMAARTSLGAQAALCARARIVVSNDSGLAHLAAAVGAPTVAIFGSTSSAWTAPLGPNVRVVQRPPVCSPCFQRTCAIGYACLEAVAVEDVLGAAAAVQAPEIAR